MESVTHLATTLDIAMLQARGVPIADENVEIEDLPRCDPADQLGERLLIKYLRPADVDKYTIVKGTSFFGGTHFLTPTPIAGRDLVSMLRLPPGSRPAYALLLKSAKLKSVRGPRRIRGGFGIEYVLEDGFSSEAMEEPGWPIEYR